MRSESLLIGLVGAATVLFVHGGCRRELAEPRLERGLPAQTKQSAEPRHDLPAPTELLQQDEPIQRDLAPGEAHRYQIDVAAEQFLQIVVDQQGVDVAATLFDPHGEKLIKMDRMLVAQGPEPLISVTKATGSHTVEIMAAAGARPTGRYRIWVEQLHPATAPDRSRASAMVIFSEANQLYWDGEHRRAAEEFDRARAEWQKLGDRSWQAESLVWLGKAHARVKEWKVAARHHQRAAGLFHEEGDARWEAIALHQLGLVYFRLRDMDRAIRSFRKALPLRQEANDLRGKAVTLHKLAHSYQRQDEVQLALDSYTQSLTLFQSARDRAHPSHNLGVLYLSLGRMDRAGDALDEAEKAWSLIGDRHRQATTLNQLGEVHRGLENLDLALDYYHRALTLRRELQDRRGEITSLANIGRVHQALDESAKARDHYLEAQRLLAEFEDPRLQARVLLDLGSLDVEQGHALEALRGYRRSLELYRTEGDPTGEAEGLIGVARAERDVGDLAAALEASADALSIFESIRPKTVSDELRTSFFATVQDHFEFHIDLLMELNQKEPEAGHDARALVASERARARSLLDLLAEAGAKIRRDADPGLLERERDLQHELNARGRARFVLRQSQPRASELEASDKAVRLAVQKLEEVRAEIRAHHPRYAALTQPLSAPEIQRQILENNTLLLEYQLGEERSFLWAVTPQTLHSFELPGRNAIEQLALRTYTLLTRSNLREARDSTRNALCELSRQLLQPVAPLIAGRRLLIVGDGALQFIPFAALPEPGTPEGCLAAPPLIVEHEITYLPSASALAILRRELDGRPVPPRTVAVVADPVFDASDPRVRASLAAGTAGTASDRSAGIVQGSFGRLHFSNQEAEAILSLVSEDQRLPALDFNANKNTVIEGRLSGHRVVHFATHGILDTMHPELSAIVLSLVDRQGQPQDGFLRAHEIYNLELPCDLVVLSACQTALGKVVRGEGLLSLTRGFMYAGAARVMVSLWKVNDASTAELMEAFYRGLFRQQLRPAAALRAAQISMSKDPRLSAPYHWAGFVIQGEWR